MELTLKEINKSFGKIQILHDLSIKLVPGVYGLLGPNGAGKTTLMNILSNTSIPTSGEILWNGKNIKQCKDNYRDVIGYLPQDVGLYPNFTARNFLRYVAVLKGLDKKETEERIRQLAEVVNLTDVLDKKCGKYSGGMKRRLGVAQSLLNDPQILILDEPTAGLDPMERIRFRNMLSEISTNRIIILSTHIVSDIDKIAKNVILLNKGRIVENIPAEVIVKKMEGRIWEIIVNNDKLNELEREFKVVNIQEKENGVSLRIISETKPMPNAICVQPSLEDVYIYYFEAHGKGCDEN